MAKAPVYHLTLGDKTLDMLGIEHLVKSVEFIEEIGKFDRVDIHIVDGVELKEAYDLVKHGNVLQLSMGYHNENIKPMTVAFMQGMKPSFKNQTVVFKFAGYLKAMDRGQKDRVLNNRTIKEVVEEIVADYAPLIVGDIDNPDTVISSTSSQSKETDFKLLEKIATMFGMRWKVEPSDTTGIWRLSLYELGYGDKADKGAKPIHAYPEKYYLSPNEALHLKDFTPESNILGVSSSVQIRSNNPNQMIAVDSKTYPLDRYNSSVRGSEIVMTVFGQVTRVQFMENVDNEEAAQIIADQLLQEDELAFVTAKNCQLNEGCCDIRVGSVRHIVPHGITLLEDIFEGDYLITKTKHVIAISKGYDTWFDCNMDCLTVPPPPEKGMGGGVGGGGTPVLIYIRGENTLRGWYMSFDADGRECFGQEITQEEILNNSYWMSFVNIYALSAVTPKPGVSPVGSMIPGLGVSVLLAGPAPLVMGLNEIRIDYPSQWNTGGSLAMDVRQLPEYSAEEAFAGVSFLFADDEEEPYELSWIQKAAYMARRAEVFKQIEEGEF